jgi:hypothetical protein
MLAGDVSNNLRVAGGEFRGAGWWFLRSYRPALPAVGGLKFEVGRLNTLHFSLRPPTSNLKPKKNQFSGKKPSATRNPQPTTRNDNFNLDHDG